MSKKLVLAGALVVILGGLNLYRYVGSGGGADGKDQASRSKMPKLTAFNFEVDATERKSTSKRNIFAFVIPPPPPEPEPEPEEAAPVVEGPDPLEVARAAAIVNMQNVNITGIISSKSGLNVLVNAPFYEGVVKNGGSLGEGIVVEAVNKNRVRISHPELDLQRDIVVE